MGGESEAGREQEILLGSEGVERLKSLRKFEVRVRPPAVRRVK